MRVRELLKKLITPEPDLKDSQAKLREDNSEPEELVPESTVSSDAEQFDEPLVATHDDSPDDVENADDEDDVGIEREEEVGALFATPSELREAGIMPEDLVEAVEVEEAEPELESEPDSELEPEKIEEPSAPIDVDETEEPAPTDELENDLPEPAGAPGSPAPKVTQIDELSLARSAVNTGFVITLATELRTPISSLRVSFDLLKDPEAIRNNPEESKRLVGNIERGIARLERQASDLLEVGYINTGSLSLIKQPVNVTEPVLAAMDISRSTAALRKVAIELEIEPDLPRPIADGFRLTQIMTHLLSNAIKFAPVGDSVVISMESGDFESAGSPDNPIAVGEKRETKPEDDPNALIVRVIDRGPGIREAHFERIFEPFYRITDEGTEGGAGVGLGLAIVKGLIELHSGKVWVKSTPREATEFGFAIPLI